MTSVPSLPWTTGSSAAPDDLHADTVEVIAVGPCADHAAHQAAVTRLDRTYH